jgi:hypothetical protein
VPPEPTEPPEGSEPPEARLPPDEATPPDALPPLDFTPPDDVGVAPPARPASETGSLMGELGKHAMNPAAESNVMVETAPKRIR